MTDGNLQLDEDEARIDALLSSMTDDDLEFAAPPADLWNDIEAAVFADSPSDTVGEDLVSPRRTTLSTSPADFAGERPSSPPQPPLSS